MEVLVFKWKLVEMSDNSHIQSLRCISSVQYPQQSRGWELGSAGPGSKVPEGRGSFHLYNSRRHPPTAFCPIMGQPKGINNVSLISKPPEPRIEPNTQQARNTSLHKGIVGNVLVVRAKEINGSWTLFSVQWKRVAERSSQLLLLTDERFHRVRLKRTKIF